MGIQRKQLIDKDTVVLLSLGGLVLLLAEIHIRSMYGGNVTMEATCVFQHRFVFYLVLVIEINTDFCSVLIERHISVAKYI